MNLLNPDAGYDLASSVRDPVKVKEVMDGEWHDYTLLLQPNIYKVQKGHWLELYIVPYLFMEEMPLDGMLWPREESAYTDEQFELIKEKLKDSPDNYGMNVTDRESFQKYLDKFQESLFYDYYEPNIVKHDHKGSFVIDNTQSYAVIPVE